MWFSLFIYTWNFCFSRYFFRMSHQFQNSEPVVTKAVKHSSSSRVENLNRSSKNEGWQHWYRLHSSNRHRRPRSLPAHLLLPSPTRICLKKSPGSCMVKNRHTVSIPSTMPRLRSWHKRHQHRQKVSWPFYRCDFRFGFGRATKRDCRWTKRYVTPALKLIFIFW